MKPSLVLEIGFLFRGEAEEGNLNINKASQLASILINKLRENSNKLEEDFGIKEIKNPETKN